jgi:hypothetical protein
MKFRQPASYYKIPPLRKFVPLEEFQPEWVTFFAMAYWQVCLPTELVARRPMFAVPNMARIYATDLYHLDGKVLSYEELVAAVGGFQAFQGTSHHQHLMFCETFGNDGSDGHVSYRMMGYRFVSSVDLPHIDQWDEMAAPAFMTDYGDDDWKFEK